MKPFVFQLTCLAGKLILLFSAFFVGTASVFLWSEISPPTVTLCEVAKNPKLYEGKKVRLAALGRAYYKMFSIEDMDCNYSAYSAGVNLPEDYEPASKDVQDFLSETNHNYLSARVLITGRIDSRVFQGCRSSMFRIKATNVELASEITVEPSDEENENNF